MRYELTVAEKCSFHVFDLLPAEIYELSLHSKLQSILKLADQKLHV